MASTKKTDNLEINNKELMNEDVIDIEFKELQKKRFRLDRDNSRVIELNTSDFNTISRLEEIYPKMLEFVEDAQAELSDDSADALKVLSNINDSMKELLNYAFNSDIADKACPDGTLFDLINGKFRFEYIMERLIALYDENFTKEFELVKKRVGKHTSKYTKKRK